MIRAHLLEKTCLHRLHVTRLEKSWTKSMEYVYFHAATPKGPSLLTQRLLQRNIEYPIVMFADELGGSIVKQVSHLIILS